MSFQGNVLSIGELLEQARRETPSTGSTGVGVRQTAADNARRVVELSDAGDDLAALWQFGILQTLDDYSSTLRRGGTGLAAAVFTEEPVSTGSIEIDAAFAALAEYLASRDGWEAPSWVYSAQRSLQTPWYAAVPTIFREEADRQSPEPFRSRGILVTARSLARA